MADPALNFRLEGQGPPLLLVHGFGISFNIWGPLIPFLRPHFTLIMVELPGIGATPLPPDGLSYMDAAVNALENLRRALGFEKWLVLGYSSGSRIAEAYVQSHSAHVTCAIFLCPLAIDARRTRFLRLALRLDDRPPAIGTWILSGWRLRFLISWIGFNLRPDPRSGAWFTEISSAPVCVLKDTIRAVAAASEHAFSVSVPYLMIWADRDLVPLRPAFPGEHDRFVHGRHAAPVESPGEVAAAIISFAAPDPTRK